MKRLLIFGCVALGLSAAVLAEPGVSTKEKPPLVGENVSVNDGGIWKTSFDNLDGWYDNRTDSSFMAKIELTGSSAAHITEDGKENWGKIAFLLNDVDFDKNPVLKLDVKSVDANSSWKLGVDTLDWNGFIPLQNSTTESGKFEILLSKSGWTGKKSFNLILIVEGDGGGFVLDEMELASGKTSTDVSSILWRTDFNDIDGWYDDGTEPSYMAKITLAQGGLAEIKETGDQNWGKTAIVMKYVDFSRHPVLNIRVVNVDKDAGWKIGLDTLEWNDFKTIKETSNESGEFHCDLTRSGWQGTKSFNLIIVVEGDNKSILLDYVELVYTK